MNGGEGPIAGTGAAPVASLRARPARGVRVGLLLVVTWLGVNAAWGATSPRDTLVSGWERGLAPLRSWVVAAGISLAGVLVWTLRRRGRLAALLPAMLLAYLLGVAASRWAIVALRPESSVLERSLLVVAAFPMLLAPLVLGVPLHGFPLRFGSWGSAGVPMGRATTTWRRALALALLGFILPVALLLQAAAGFAPWQTGALWPALPGIVALALVNALGEELLFRGLIQRPLVDRLGASAGVWFQAAFFGIHHWGSSPSIVAGLAMFPFLTLLGALWGRATLETRGLAWSVALHGALGVAYFSSTLR